MSDFPNPNADRTKNRAHKPDPAEIAARANGKAAGDPVKPKGNAWCGEHGRLLVAALRAHGVDPHGLSASEQASWLMHFIADGTIR